MRLRPINNRDITELERIHNKFFKNDFEFPNLTTNFMSSFVITDEDERIIVGGGVRSIAESIIITDKDIEIGKRREALQEILTVSAFTAKVREYDQLHAFIVDDDRWERHLKRVGFRETRGKSLVLNL